MADLPHLNTRWHLCTVPQSALPSKGLLSFWPGDQLVLLAWSSCPFGLVINWSFWPGQVVLLAWLSFWPGCPFGVIVLLAWLSFWPGDQLVLLAWSSCPFGLVVLLA